MHFGFFMFVYLLPISCFPQAQTARKLEFRIAFYSITLIGGVLNNACSFFMDLKPLP